MKKFNTETIKAMVVFGTRPEAIKMAPLILKLKENNHLFETTVVVTGQHREMLDQVLELFNIIPDYDLNVMSKEQTLTDITVQVLSQLQKIVEEVSPDIMLIHGDTTTTLSASLVAFYNRVAIGHIEAGLRTNNKFSPFPEEINRQVTDLVADLYFAPTKESEQNLLQEHISKQSIFITGNTAIDTLEVTIDNSYFHPVLELLKQDSYLILFTMHRRENQGEPMVKVFKMLRHFVEKHPKVEIVYPIHMNPKIQEIARKYLGNHQQIHLISPLNVVDFHNLISKSYFVMTDSGGIQEEAPSLGKPVLVLRDTTERPEGVKSGNLKLVGTDPKVIEKAMIDLISNKEEYKKMSNAKNPYGDGKASERIIKAIAYYFGYSQERPLDFVVED